ncbi:hypothetical protein F5X96DRAFT_666129 [Biscogniauxia mediterranea]|nr:hypothetical protein F5X96DRAFT_666129 [Biscogniauxia mediterranea]
MPSSFTTISSFSCGHALIMTQDSSSPPDREIQERTTPRGQCLSCVCARILDSLVVGGLAGVPRTAMRELVLHCETLAQHPLYEACGVGELVAQALRPGGDELAFRRAVVALAGFPPGIVGGGNSSPAYFVVY